MRGGQAEPREAVCLWAIKMGSGASSRSVTGPTAGSVCAGRGPVPSHYAPT